jgi:acyl-coenzyme A thioesterase PaaI-like protein
MALTEPQPEVPSYVGALGIDLSLDGDLAIGRVEIIPSFLKPGTDRVRMGVLATLVDMVAGSPAHGVINPTVDLRVSLLSRVPTEGVMHLVCRPVKVGQRLFVGETILHTGDIERPFARSMVTFMNRIMAEASRYNNEHVPVGPLGADSYDDALLLRESAPGVLEMDAHEAVQNGFAGTIQGGAQALLAEIAGERAVAHHLGADAAQHEVVDLEIRYLNRLRVGPAVATGEVLPGAFDGVCVRVPITDAGGDDRIVSFASLLCRPVAGA